MTSSNSEIMSATITINNAIKLSPTVFKQVVYKVKYHFPIVINLQLQSDQSTLVLDLANTVTSETKDSITSHIQRTIAALQRVNQRFPEPTPLIRRDQSRMSPDGANLFYKSIIGSGGGHVTYTGFSLALVREVRSLIAALFQIVTRGASGDGAQDMEVPSSIAVKTLNELHYVPSFHHHLCFVSHLKPDEDTVKAFPEIWKSREENSDVPPSVYSSCALPDRALNPAICLHTYPLLRGKEFANGDRGTWFNASGKVFRFESGNHSDLERLFEFSMHELIFVGPEHEIDTHAASLKKLMGHLLECLDLSGEIVIANDMFIGADAKTDQARMFAQLSTQAKIEMLVHYGDSGSELMAVASLNCHGSHFTKPLSITAKKDDIVYQAASLCFGIGIERLSYAIASHHGTAALDLVKRLNPQAVAERCGLV